MPRPEPDNPPTVGFFTPRLRPHDPARAWPENLYWALVAQWRREGRQLPSGASTGPGQDTVDALPGLRSWPVSFGWLSEYPSLSVTCALVVALDAERPWP